MLRVVKNEEELLSSPFDEVTITAEEYSLLKLLLGMAIQDLEDEDTDLLEELRCMMGKLGEEVPSRIHITTGSDSHEGRAFWADKAITNPAAGPVKERSSQRLPLHLDLN